MRAEAILDLVPAYGAPALFVLAFLACFGLPVPAALALLAAGAFGASGELAWPVVAAAALAGALLGDQAGYWLGALGGGWTEARIRRRPGGAKALERARAFAGRWGGWAIFFSRWAASPLGGPVNLACGSLGMSWARFSLASLAGEGVWVSLYLTLGFIFADSFVVLAATLGDLGRAIAAGVVALLLGWRLRGVILRAARRRRQSPAPRRRKRMFSRVKAGSSDCNR